MPETNQIVKAAADAENGTGSREKPALSRLAALRHVMGTEQVDLCLVTTADAHGSEYPGAHYEARAYLSGFTGSAGTLAVTKDWAGLWTDGRYFLQAETELFGTGIMLYKMGEPGVPELLKELRERLPDRGTLAYDGVTVSAGMGAELRAMASARHAQVIFRDLPGMVWKDRPPLPKKPVYELPETLAGETRREKLSRLREAIKEAGADCHVVSALDETAWSLNLRGSDIPCNPVFLSYLYLDQDQVLLYGKKQAFSGELEAALRRDGVELRPYEAVFSELPELTGHKTVLADLDQISDALAACLSGAEKIQSRPDPAVLMKAVKNEAEILGIREAHRKDGIALTKFLYWLKTHIGTERITERSASEKLEQLRQEQEYYFGPSFETIAAYGKNGAVVHYSATEASDTELRPEGLFLLDCGGQYLEGTTDVTRTVALGPVTEWQKKTYTAVLKGMLALQEAVFLEGCTGINLDYLAREPLWKLGLDYRHGTGHGVGCLLNVHEGPNAFRWRGKSAVFRAGMVTSDEPGYYEPGAFGIRTENLLLCEKREKTEYGQFLGFSFLTLAPIDESAVCDEDMSSEDVRRLRTYQERVYDTLSPYLDEQEREWLKKETGRG